MYFVSFPLGADYDSGSGHQLLGATQAPQSVLGMRGRFGERSGELMDKTNCQGASVRPLQIALPIGVFFQHFSLVREATCLD